MPRATTAALALVAVLALCQLAAPVQAGNRDEELLAQQQVRTAAAAPAQGPPLAAWGGLLWGGDAADTPPAADPCAPSAPRHLPQAAQQAIIDNYKAQEQQLIQDQVDQQERHTGGRSGGPGYGGEDGGSQPGPGYGGEGGHHGGDWQQQGGGDECAGLSRRECRRLRRERQQGGGYAPQEPGQDWQAPPAEEVDCTGLSRRKCRKLRKQARKWAGRRGGDQNSFEVDASSVPTGRGRRGGPGVRATYHYYGPGYESSSLFCADAFGANPPSPSHRPWTAYCADSILGPMDASKCGRCIRITNTRTGRSVEMTVVDKCGTGGMDMEPKVRLVGLL